MSSGRDPLICHFCGRSYKARYPCESGTSKFCSRECYNEWASRKYYSRCSVCGKIHTRLPSSDSQLVRSTGTCSKKCSAILSNKTRPNKSKLEKQVGAYLKLSICLEPQYVFELGTIDFAVPSEKIAIQVNGDYWHVNPVMYSEPITNAQKRAVVKDKKQKEWFKNNGWSLFVIWERDVEISGIQSVCDNILSKIRLLLFERHGSIEMVENILMRGKTQ